MTQKDAIIMLENMKRYIIQKINKTRISWIFLYISPFNSIYLLHLHVIDMKKTGPMFSKLSFKNLPLNEMLLVLKEEAGN